MYSAAWESIRGVNSALSGGLSPHIYGLCILPAWDCVCVYDYVVCECVYVVLVYWVTMDVRALYSRSETH